MSAEACMIAKMTDDKLGESCLQAAQNERKSMHTVLLHIKEVERRRYYAKVGRGSLFEYVTKDLKYSEGSANRRIAAARLLKDLPEIAESIQSGALNLSNLVLLQSTMRAVEKKTHEKFDLREKRELIELIQDKTTENVVRELVELFPEAARPEKARMVAGRKTEVTVPFDEEEMKHFTRVRELASHKNDNFSWQELFVFLADYYLQKEDPLQKPLGKGKFARAKAKAAARARTHEEFGSQPINAQPAWQDRAASGPRNELGGLGEQDDGNDPKELNVLSGFNDPNDQNGHNDRNEPIDRHKSCVIGAEIPPATNARSATSLKNQAARVSAVGANLNRQPTARKEHEQKGQVTQPSSKANIQATHRFSAMAREGSEVCSNKEEGQALFHWVPKNQRHSRYISAQAKRVLRHRSGSQCEHMDPNTGERCRRRFHLQPDHVIPISKGGSSELENLQLLCRVHNLAKGDRIRF